MDDILYPASLIIFAIASFVFIRAQKVEMVPALLVGLMSPLIMMGFYGVIMLIVSQFTLSETAFAFAPLVFAILCLIGAIKYAMDKKKAAETEKSKASSDAKENSV